MVYILSCSVSQKSRRPSSLELSVLRNNESYTFFTSALFQGRDMYYYLSIILLVSLAFLGGCVSGEKGSCRAARKCCNGKDADCIVQTSAINSYNKIENNMSSEEPCYCDHGCLEVGDCCPDFKDYCGGEFKLVVAQEQSSYILFRWS